MLKKKINIEKQLFNLGFQIGHFISLNNFNSKLNFQFLLGHRRCFYVINPSITLTFLQRAISFYSKLLKSNPTTLFYFSEIDSTISNSNSIIRFFLNNHLLLKLKWSFLHLKWLPGLITNFNKCFLRFIKLIAKKIFYFKNTISKKRNNQSLKKAFSSNKLFITFFLKLFFMLEEKKQLNITSAHDLDFKIEFNKISHIYRVIIFLKYWNSFFAIPDLLFTINSKQYSSPINEFNTLKIPIISILDTNSSLKDITYPIPMNDDSIIGVFFIISLFTNITKKSQLLNYNKINI